MGTLRKNGPKRRIHRDAVIQAFAAFLREFPWTHVATLTFTSADFAPSEETAGRRFLAWITRLGELDGRPVKWFMLVHRGKLGRRMHVHALLRSQTLGAKAMAGAWRHGQTRIESFRREDGFPEYLGAAVQDGADFDIEANPTRRHARNR